jgi:hypothetical protein
MLVVGLPDAQAALDLLSGKTQKAGLLAGFSLPTPPGLRPP